MATNLSYYKSLLADYLGNDLAPDKARELFDFIRDEPLLADTLLQEAGGEAYIRQVAAGRQELDTAVSDRMRGRLLTAIRTPKQAQVIEWKRWWAAAAILVLVLTGGYFYFTGRPAITPVAISTGHDVNAPANSRAMITLGNGTQVYLDSVASGQLARQGNTRLVKLPGGQVAYQSDENSINTAVMYNTLTNPLGSKVISLTLSDGTQVWLNTGSSLKYPTAFTGNERQVEITGEAYFEITHHAAMPFSVKKGDATVQVLGTHFNIKAYEDESAIRVTLLEGSVKVMKGNAGELLKPGEQAIIRNALNEPADHSTTGISKGIDVDLDAVMAWKNGLFSFNHTDLPTVMRALGRCYNVDIVYEGKIPNLKFGGEITRNSNASQVLKILEESNVHCRIEGRKIIVMP